MNGSVEVAARDSFSSLSKRHFVRACKIAAQLTHKGGNRCSWVRDRSASSKMSPVV